MSDAVFPASVAAALDRLTVPSLPSGFAERLLARIESGDLPLETPTELPQLRRPVALRRWLRPGRVALGIAAFGITSATAAASGVFGDPVYVPVVSEALAKADIVQLPVKAPPAQKPKVVAEPALPKGETKPEETGTAAVRELYTRLRADKEFRQLPPRERTAIARAELEDMLRSGTIKAEDIRAAMRELNQERRQKEIARREKVAERVERYRKAGPQEQAEMRKEQRLRNAETRQDIKTAFDALPADDKQRLFELRRALRTAPPEERPAIRREIREILKNSPAAPMPDEGNPEPAR